MKFSTSIHRTFLYLEYRLHINNLLLMNQTTGSDQSQEMIAYTRLNVMRMNRLDKTVQLSTELLKRVNELSKPITIYAITEAWCGDAAQNLPLFNLLAKGSTNINFVLLMRDEHPLVMDDYLTNGNRAIPKLIAVDQSNEVLFTWGPRPMATNYLQQQYKSGLIEYDAFSKKLHAWYAKDKTVALQLELSELLTKWMRTSALS
jgi:hypothetical protein